jgi:predicted nucleic acid-binding Zn ribbon protein
MPVYAYRREDGTMFEIRQSFNDEALTVDPQTGQRVVRVVQSAGVIFKGSGFYVNDSKSASKQSLTTPAKDGKGESKSGEAGGESASTASGDTSAAASASTSTADAEPKKIKELSPIPQPSAAD